jgi:hypothetical protein
MGVSFHPEVRITDLHTWVALATEQLTASGIEPDAILDDVRTHRDAVAVASRGVADNFATIVRSPRWGV